jgi:hypothetical protein
VRSLEGVQPAAARAAAPVLICYPPGMSEQHDELRRLAEQVASGPDDVAEFAADVAQIYRRERMVILGLAAVDAMVRGDEREIDESDPRLVAVRERLRDRLKVLLVWARDTGRM